jgi:hypothetical protein
MIAYPLAWTHKPVTTLRVNAFGIPHEHLQEILAIPSYTFPSGFDASLVVGFALEEIEGYRS